MQTDSSHIPELFERFLVHSCHCTGRESFLLAISGGIDSMVMLDLFHRKGLKIAIAHCNFSLRGEESDGDEAFVRQAALGKSAAFYVRKFETLQYAKDEGVSTQMAARELRYQWFNDLATAHNCNLIATAHQKDDLVETFLINLSRGTGINGLTGIKPRNERLIRPLLFLSREEINLYAKTMKIGWREDSSNETDKYLRNRIRHILLPDIHKTLPGFADALTKTAAQLQETRDLLEAATAQFIKEAVTIIDQRMQIKIEKIRHLPSSRILLYEVLRRSGFNYDTVSRLFDTLDGQSGKQFFSNTHELTVDRSFLIIQPLVREDGMEILIPKDAAAVQFPVNLTFRLFENRDTFDIPGDRNTASFDLNTITYPLTIRKWKKGDYFYPLGMKGRKKLSDFFVDEKIAIPDKKRIRILESAGNIIWVIGWRIDDRNKVTSSTGSMLQITYHPGNGEK